MKYHKVLEKVTLKPYGRNVSTHSHLYIIWSAITILLSPTCHNNKKLPGPHMVLDQVHPSKAKFYTDLQKPEGLRKNTHLGCNLSLTKKNQLIERPFLCNKLKVSVQCPIHWHISGVVVVVVVW